MDWLYLLGMLVVWFGNLRQIALIIKTHSTKSFSFFWLYAILISFLIRMPRALTSDYWVWAISYIVSVIVIATLIGVTTYYKKEGK